MLQFRIVALLVGGGLVAGCNPAPAEAPVATPTVTATNPPVAANVAIPASLAPFGDGYPRPGDPCLRLGESALTADWLDDSAILVGCPTAAAAAATGGRAVAIIDGIHLASIPTGDANAGMAGTAKGPD